MSVIVVLQNSQFRIAVQYIRKITCSLSPGIKLRAHARRLIITRIIATMFREDRRGSRRFNRRLYYL